MKKINYLLMIACMILFLTGCGKNVYETGVEALQSGNYEDAIQCFEKSLEKGKNTADSYRGLGIALWETQKYEEAAKALDSALETGTSKDGTIYNMLGCCYLQTKEYEKAQKMFEKALEDTNCSEEMVKEIEFNQIVALEKLEKTDEAKSLLGEYVEKYPDDERAAKEKEFLETR